MTRRHRKAVKATDASVHIGLGGAALVLQFMTVKEGDITVAIPVRAARWLADTLLAKADEAETLTNQGGGGSRH